jgi:hypothetical protein
LGEEAACHKCLYFAVSRGKDVARVLSGLAVLN